MRILVYTITIFFFSMMVTSCTGPYTMENSGSTINLGLDDPFEIELESNASTGYSWNIVSFDSTVIKQMGEKVYTSNDDKPGSPGLATFKFSTIGAGETTIVLVYKRNWENMLYTTKHLK